jgi:penicillin-binding protein 1A
MEMANVYATLADGGWRNKQITITKVVFPDGHADSSWGKQHRTKVLSSAVAAVETEILQHNVEYGTATLSAIGCPTAAKTGTTSGLVDAWLDGYSPNRATVVWMGYPQANVSMTDVHGQPQFGGLLPAQIWHNFMVQVATPPCAQFINPASVPMTYAPFSGYYQRAGFSAAVANTGPVAAPGTNGAVGAPGTAGGPPAAGTTAANAGAGAAASQGGGGAATAPSGPVRHTAPAQATPSPTPPPATAPAAPATGGGSGAAPTTPPTGGGAFNTGGASVPPSTGH